MTTVYDAVKDFPASNNNAGPWTFGYSEAGDSAYRMIRFDNTAANVGGFPGVVWSKSGYNTAGTPSIWRNLAAFPRYGVAPGQLSLHPGPRPRGDFTILRFTAPIFLFLVRRQRKITDGIALRRITQLRIAP